MATSMIQGSEDLLFDRTDLNVADNTFYDITTVNSELNYKKLVLLFLTSDNTPAWASCEIPYIKGGRTDKTELRAFAFVTNVFYAKFFSIILTNEKLSIRYTLTNYSNCHITGIKVYGVK